MVSKTVSILRGPSFTGSSIIIRADVCRLQLIGYTLIGLLREINPVADVFTMIDDHISNGTNAFILKCFDE